MKNLGCSRKCPLWVISEQANPRSKPAVSAVVRKRPRGLKVEPADLISARPLLKSAELDRDPMEEVVDVLLQLGGGRGDRL